MSIDKKKNIKAAQRHLQDLFHIESVSIEEKSVIFELLYKFDHEKSKQLLIDRFQLAGYKFELLEENHKLILIINSKATFKIPRINIILFFVTLFSVYFVPLFYEMLFNLDYGSIVAQQAATSEWMKFYFGTKTYLTTAFLHTLEALAEGRGIIFTIAMISILFVHEMGHYVASRRRGIITSYPYFIPAPNIIGTFGAVIKSKSPFWNRRDLIEVGAAGPIAGWIIAVGWLTFGLGSAELVEIKDIPAGEFILQLGPTLMNSFIAELVVGTIPEGFTYNFPEAAFAGWVGLLITALNMLPIGMLDGGHVVYGLFPKKQKLIASIVMGFLVILGLLSPIWWFFAAFGLFFGLKHPPTMQDSLPLTKTTVIMGVVSLIIFILSFTPIPIG